MKVGLFVTCLVDLMRPRIGFAAIRLLEAAGCEVAVPKTQTCCGQPAYNSGDRASAQALARKVLDEFEGYDYVVAPSGSCAGLRELGVKAQPRALLAKVPGLRLQEMEEAETCCGFGGAFAVKFGEISTHIAERKCANIAACGVDAVVLGDLGCMLNIEGRLRRRGDHKTQVLHVAEVLAGKTSGQ